jgi:hypothetical protein
LSGYDYRHIRRYFSGVVVVTDFSLASIASESVEDADNQSFKTIVLFCGVGLIVSLCLMTLGVDLSAGLI